MPSFLTDHLLGSLEGAVSPIWITLVVLVDEPPPLPALRQAFATLVDASERLQMAWRGGWTPRRWTRAEQDAAVLMHPPVASAQSWILQLGARPARLEVLPALRLHLAPLEAEAGPRWALAVQLHHAMGDARALGHTLERLWEALERGVLPPDPSPRLLATDAELLRWLLRRWPAALAVVQPKRRLLARRALALPRQGDRVGAPLQHTVVMGSLPSPRTRDHAEIFFAALLAQAARSTPRTDGLLRLRVPIDLSREMGWGPVLGNTCMAIPLEFPLTQVRARCDDAQALRGLVADTLRGAIQSGYPASTLLECLLSARLVPVGALRRGAEGGFTADPRTNTLVTTHIGRIDHYFQRAPFQVHGMLSHTSTWGVNAWTWGPWLGLTATGFEGLQDTAAVRAFAEGCADWIEDHGLGARSPRSPLWGDT